MLHIVLLFNSTLKASKGKLHFMSGTDFGLNTGLKLIVFSGAVIYSF